MTFDEQQTSGIDIVQENHAGEDETLHSYSSR
jgi:hypothetical protein